jgi:phosphate transport system ATP-binding protein
MTFAAPERLRPTTSGSAASVPNDVRSTVAKMSAREVSVRYNGKSSVAGVSFDIPEQRITAIIGPSGCGKSTFLATLNRMTDLIPGCSITGHITLDDQDIRGSTIDPQALRCRVGMIFQRANPFPLSIRRNIEMPLKQHGIAHASDRAEVLEDVLQNVGLWREVKDRLDQPALALSGGQQQRLCIARALALKPTVLLMDEPCSALDPISSGVVEDLMTRLRETYTVVVVTHNLAQARRVADRVALFWTDNGVGRLIEQGTTQQMFEAPKNDITAAYIHGHRG